MEGTSLTWNQIYDILRSKQRTFPILRSLQGLWSDNRISQIQLLIIEYKLYQLLEKIGDYSIQKAGSRVE